MEIIYADGESVHPTAKALTLPYMAPDATGRTCPRHSMTECANGAGAILESFVNAKCQEATYKILQGSL